MSIFINNHPSNLQNDMNNEEKLRFLSPIWYRTQSQLIDPQG